MFKGISFFLLKYYSDPHQHGIYTCGQIAAIYVWVCVYIYILLTIYLEWIYCKESDAYHFNWNFYKKSYPSAQQLPLLRGLERCMVGNFTPNFFFWRHWFSNLKLQPITFDGKNLLWNFLFLGDYARKISILIIYFW